MIGHTRGKKNAFKRCRESVAEGSRCKKGYHFAAAMGRTRWPTIKNIDSLVMKHLANASFSSCTDPVFDRADANPFHNSPFLPDKHAQADNSCSCFH